MLSKVILLLESVVVLQRLALVHWRCILRVWRHHVLSSRFFICQFIFILQNIHVFIVLLDCKNASCVTIVGWGIVRYNCRWQHVSTLLSTMGDWEFGDTTLEDTAMSHWYKTLWDTEYAYTILTGVFDGNRGFFLWREAIGGYFFCGEIVDKEVID